MTMFKWVTVADGSRYRRNERFYNVGFRKDGTLHNPNGYPDDEVRAAVAAAEERRHQRRQEGAAKAAATRRRRQERRVYEVAQKIATGGTYGPARRCVVCLKGLSDPESIDRGIGSDCWQGVLDRIEDYRSRAGASRG
jgi:hypothetical protein